jgi:hypothetical protein
MEAKVVIKKSGVFKFETSNKEAMRRGAAGKLDFMPEDFIDKRKNK